MARGLSDLQLWILERAARFRYVRYADVMLNYFNWESEKPPKFYGQRRTVMDEATGESRVEATPPDMVGMPIYDDAVFNPDKIGRNKYNSAMASLSRCCHRLQARGLVQILHGTYSHIAGVKITDEGRAWLGENGRILQHQTNDSPAATATDEQAKTPAAVTPEPQKQAASINSWQVRCPKCFGVFSRTVQVTGNVILRWVCPRCGHNFRE